MIYSVKKCSDCKPACTLREIDNGETQWIFSRSTGDTNKIRQQSKEYESPRIKFQSV